VSNFLFTLVVPEGLASLALQSGSRGYLQGTIMSEEYLGVGLSSQVDDQDPVIAAGSRPLTYHWSWVSGSSTKQLVRWIEVKPGFTAELQDKRISRENISDWIADGLPLPEVNEPSLCCIEPAEPQPRVNLIVAIAEEVLAGRVHIIPTARQLSRLDGLAPVAALRSKRVAIVGLGSGGSAAAVNLASAGVGTLHLFDKDELSVDNLFRHACDLRHVGREKARAVKDLIDSYHLPTDVQTHNQNVVDDTSHLWSVSAEVDLIICATDSVQSRKLVNYLAVHTGVPLLLAATFRNASIGEIIRVRPGESACYECTRLALSATGALQLLPDAEESESLVPYADESIAAGAEIESNRGSRADVAMVAALLSRMAIDTLLQSETLEPMPGDYLTWGGRAISDRAQPFNFERPFSTTWVHMQRAEKCPVCATLGKELDQGTAETYRQIMASLGAASS
jgi:molybdopterin/thiamine biosynthesis adenylyltransferase